MTIASVDTSTLYETNARDIVACLRSVADNIEKGRAPFELRGAVLVLAGRTKSVDLYSWGDLDNYSTLGVLSRAERHIHSIIDGSS